MSPGLHCISSTLNSLTLSLAPSSWGLDHQAYLMDHVFHHVDSSLELHQLSAAWMFHLSTS